MLELDGLVLSHGDGDFRVTADWSLKAGRKVALIGPSGAGKSTLLNAIAGFHTPEAGRIRWQGHDITGAAPGARPVAMLFQDGNLFPHLSVARNVGLGIRPDLRLTSADRDRVIEAIAQVGLSGFEARKPGALSGGQQSRAALARILVQNRPLILLDEPFAALGPALRAEMLDLVARLCDRLGATLLMVSHAVEDAQRIADDIVLIDGGVAEPPVAMAQAFAEPSEKLRRYLGTS